MSDARLNKVQRANLGQDGVRPGSTSGGNVQSMAPKVPDYLEKHYWWAYVRPRAIRFFERDWLVDLILLGNYRRLLNLALDTLGKSLPGQTLQIACVYGNLTEQLRQRVNAGQGHLDVVDVLAAQLDNLRHKVPDPAVRLIQRDSTMLGLPDASYEQVMVYFLLHEQPREVRMRTLHEALRVLKPEGRLMIVDFARPPRWHPMRYLWLPILTVLEPFAPDLWTEDITDWAPLSQPGMLVQRQTVFGGFFQVLLFQKPAAVSQTQ